MLLFFKCVCVCLCVCVRACERAWAHVCGVGGGGKFHPAANGIPQGVLKFMPRDETKLDRVGDLAIVKFLQTQHVTNRGRTPPGGCPANILPLFRFAERTRGWTMTVTTSVKTGLFLYVPFPP